jgi:hypothetical protein
VVLDIVDRTILVAITLAVQRRSSCSAGLCRPGREALGSSAVMRRAGVSHSLRARLVTAAARYGRFRYVIMKQTGYRSGGQLSGYIRDAELFIDTLQHGLPVAALREQDAPALFLRRAKAEVFRARQCVLGCAMV